MISLASPDLRLLRVDLYPRTYLPLFITKVSLLLMFQLPAFFTISQYNNINYIIPLLYSYLPQLLQLFRLILSMYQSNFLSPFSNEYQYRFFKFSQKQLNSKRMLHRNQDQRLTYATPFLPNQQVRFTLPNGTVLQNQNLYASARGGNEPVANRYVGYHSSVTPAEPLKNSKPFAAKETYQKVGRENGQSEKNTEGGQSEDQNGKQGSSSSQTCFAKYMWVILGAIVIVCGAAAVALLLGKNQGSSNLITEQQKVSNQQSETQEQSPISKLPQKIIPSIQSADKIIEQKGVTVVYPQIQTRQDVKPQTDVKNQNNTKQEKKVLPSTNTTDIQLKRPNTSVSLQQQTVHNKTITASPAVTIPTTTVTKVENKTVESTKENGTDLKKESQALPVTLQKQTAEKKNQTQPLIKKQTNDTGKNLTQNLTHPQLPPKTLVSVNQSLPTTKPSSLGMVDDSITLKILNEKVDGKNATINATTISKTNATLNESAVNKTSQVIPNSIVNVTKVNISQPNITVNHNNTVAQPITTPNPLKKQIENTTFPVIATNQTKKDSEKPQVNMTTVVTSNTTLSNSTVAPIQSPQNQSSIVKPANQTTIQAKKYQISLAKPSSEKLDRNFQEFSQSLNKTSQNLRKITK